MLREKVQKGDRPRVVIGRDARTSGGMVRDVVSGVLRASGVDVLDLGLSTTPTVEMTVPDEKASGGIVITASHNPAEWNALKFLGPEGEFISEAEGERLLKIADEGEAIRYAAHDEIGEYQAIDRMDKHLEAIRALSLVDTRSIGERGFRIVVDGVNSTGGVFVPALLEKLGVEEVIRLHCDPNGRFAHDPEPLPANIRELSEKVREEKADLGIVVDPDVDRLAFVDENGEPFGEEYTLVAVADHVLQQRKGNTVSNLSSTQALKDVTEQRGGSYFASAVGEVNVVAKMKEVDAVIGGEGNGGVILPQLHYGRDALVGIAIFLTQLAREELSCSALRARYPDYHMAKEKVRSEEGMDPERLLEAIAEEYEGANIDRQDGVKILFDKEWVHLRKSNTEPILRVYTESVSPERAKELARRFVEELQTLARKSGTLEK